MKRSSLEWTTENRRHREKTKRGNPETGKIIIRIKEIVAAGDVDAMKVLGDFYKIGQYVVEDEAEVARLYKFSMATM